MTGEGRSFKDAQRRVGKSSYGSDYYFLCRMARIVEVDYERANCSIQLLDGSATYREVEFAVGSWGPRSFVGTMPERGSMAAVAFFPDSIGHPRPRVIAYFPIGFRQMLNWDPVQRRSDAKLGPSFVDPIRYGMPKLYPGDALLKGSGGAFLKCRDDADLQTGSGLAFLLRSIDRHAVMRAINYSYATGAGRHHSGPVIRNPRSPVTPGGGLSEANGITPHLFHDGRQIYYVVPQSVAGGTIIDGQQPYTEDRLVLREFSDMIPDVFGELDLADVDQWRQESGLRNSRLLEIIRGTFVGDDLRDDEASLYSRPLRLKLFGDSFQAEEFEEDDWEYVNAAPDPLSEQFLPVADHFRLWSAVLNGGVPFIRDVDKHGVLFEVLGATSVVHPMGSGVSEIRTLQGARKEHLGKTVAILDPPHRLDAIAGSRGAPIPSGISEYQTVEGGLHFKVLGPDATGEGYVLEVVKGNMKIRVNGDVEVRYTGQLQEWVDGNVQRVVGGDVLERINGSYKREVVGDEIIHIGGSRFHMIVGNDTLHAGSRVINVAGGMAMIIGSGVPPPPVPPPPAPIGAAGESSVPGADPSPGQGSGVSPAPQGNGAEETFTGPVNRKYLGTLQEQFVSAVDREYVTTTSEKFTGPVSRQYRTTLSEEVVAAWTMRTGIMTLQSLGIASLSGEGAVVIRSSISIAEQAPVVLRG